MYKYVIMSKFTVCLVYIFLLNFRYIVSEISDYRRCGDPTCSEPVSLATSLTTYPSSGNGILSFKKNTHVIIFSKSAGSRPDLWGAEINGKRGYVPLKFVREKKVLKKQLDYIVPTETFVDIKSEIEHGDRTAPHAEDHVAPVVRTETGIFKGVLANDHLPDKVLRPHEVIDGTTIFYTPGGFSEAHTSGNESEKQSVDSSQPEQSESTPLSANEIETKVLEPEPPVTDSVVPSLVENDILAPKEIDSNIKASILDEGEDVDDQNEKEKTEQIVVENSQTVKESDSITQKVAPIGMSQTETNVISDSTVKPVELEETSSTANIRHTESVTIRPAADTSQTENESERDQNSFVDKNMKSTISESTVLSNDPLKTENESEKTKVNPIIAENPTNIVAEIAEAVEAVNTVDHEIKTNANPEKDLPSIVLKTVPNIYNLYTKIANEASVTETENRNVKTAAETFSEDKVTTPDSVSLNNPSEESVNLSSTSAEAYEENKYVESAQIEETIEMTTVSSIDQIIQPQGHDDGTLEVRLPDLDTMNDSQLLTTSEPVDNTDRSYSFEISTTVSNNDNLEPILKKQTTPTPHPITVEINEESVTSETATDNKIPLESEAIINQESVASDIPEEIVPELSPEVDNAILEEAAESEEKGYFEQLLSLFYTSSTPNTESLDEHFYNREDASSMFTQQESYSCHNDGSSNSQCLDEQDFEKETVSEFGIPDTPYFDVIIYLSVTSVSVLIFTLGYYYIEKLRQDGKLIARINELEKAILVAVKENAIIRDDLQAAKDKLTTIEDSSFDSKGTVLKLEAELEQTITSRSELEEKLAVSEKELETATEAGFELNKMLADFISSQSGNDSLVESLDLLQKQLNEQQHTIAEMTISGKAETQKCEQLQAQVVEMADKSNGLQNELDKMVDNLVKIQEEKKQLILDTDIRRHQMQIEFEETIQLKDAYAKQTNENLGTVTDELNNVQHLLNVKDNELTILKDSLAKLNKNDTGNMENILEISHVRAELQEANDQQKRLNTKLLVEVNAKSEIEKKLKEQFGEAEQLRANLEEATKDKIESQTRLEVLSSYFKDKESQLQEELSKHQQLWLHNKGEANSTIERIKSLQEEVQNYKLQNEMLKKEILDQEVSLRSQISVMEKKNHESWLQSRQIERRLEESKQEASQLRNRLTIVEKNMNNSEDKSQYRVLSPLNTNGDITASPVHLGEHATSPPGLFPHPDQLPTSPPLPFIGLPPPPPPGVPFMPPPPGAPFMPPPPALYPGDRRPPPLGRMSSPPPPPPSTFSPTRTYSPYDRDGSPPLSPRNRSYRSPDPQYRDMDGYHHRSPLPLPPYDSRPIWDERQSFRPLDPRASRSKDHTNENV